MQAVGGTGPQGDGGQRLELAINALRARIDEEFRIAERLDSKIRQAFALVAALFAVAQTVAFGGFTQSNVSGDDRLVIVALTVLAAIALAQTAHKVVDAEDLRGEKDIDPGYIETWARDCDDEEFAKQMVVHLRQVADRRAENNAERAALYTEDRGVLFWARWTLILTGVEILFAVILRV
jgi:hypothetical protein